MATTTHLDTGSSPASTAATATTHYTPTQTHPRTVLVTNSTTVLDWPLPSGATCELGGGYMHWTNPGDFNSTNVHVGLAGPDPRDPRLVECCAPFPVHFAPPCLVWCEYDETAWRASPITCLRGKGVNPQAYGGMSSGNSRWIGGLVPNTAQGIVAIFSVCMAVVAVVCGITFGIVQLVSWRSRRIELNNVRRLRWSSDGANDENEGRPEVASVSYEGSSTTTSSSSPLAK
jgi:hypothetical protein